MIVAKQGRVVVLVTGVPGAGKTTVARALSVKLNLPLLSMDAIKESLFDTLGVGDRAWGLQLRQAALEVIWSVLPDCPAGAIVDVWLHQTWNPDDAASVLARTDVVVLEVLCDVPGELAAARYAARKRHPGHLPPDQATLSRIVAAAPLMKPLGLGPSLRLDTSRPVNVAQLTDWVRRQSPRNGSWG